MRNRQDPMLFVTKYKNDYRVRIRGYDQNNYLIDATFFKWMYKTDAKTKKEAMIFRDEILQELEDKRIFSIYWTPSITYFINGLYLDLVGGRVCARTPNKKGLPQKLFFSIRRFGLKGAFDEAIKALEKHRRKKDYPSWVVNKAWKLVKKHYQVKST